MLCDAFIQNYSDFRDRLIDEALRREYERHLVECEKCCRYDRVVERGVAVYCDLPAATASPDFMPRLQHRIYHVEDAARLTSKRALGSAALVAVAGVGFLAVTWLPFATRMSVEIQLPTVAVDAPATAGPANLFSPGPYVSSGSFLLPLNPTLDEPMDLFSTYSLTIPVASSFEVERPSGQLDDSR